MGIPANSGDGWNHAVPPRARCRIREGGFARRRESGAARIVAIDLDPAVLPSRASGVRQNPRPDFVEADFLASPIDGPYDFVSMIASLHHLPFDESVSKAACALAPGGVLAVLGLDRLKSRIDAAIQGTGA